MAIGVAAAIMLDDLAIDEAAREVRRGAAAGGADLRWVVRGIRPTIDSHVRNLRRKLGSRPDGGDYVETVRGVGYRVARA